MGLRVEIARRALGSVNMNPPHYNDAFDLEEERAPNRLKERMKPMRAMAPPPPSPCSTRSIRVPERAAGAGDARRDDPRPLRRRSPPSPSRRTSRSAAPRLQRRQQPARRPPPRGRRGRSGTSRLVPASMIVHAGSDGTGCLLMSSRTCEARGAARLRPGSDTSGRRWRDLRRSFSATNKVTPSSTPAAAGVHSRFSARPSESMSAGAPPRRRHPTSPRAARRRRIADDARRAKKHLRPRDRRARA